MKVIITTLGSGGDVVPFIAIGKALAGRGHRTILATNPHFEPAVRDAGLDFSAVDTAQSYDRITQNPDLWHPRHGLEYMSREIVLPGLAPVFETVKRLHEPGQTVVVTNCLSLGARIARETLDLRLITLHVTPVCLRSLRDPGRMAGAGAARWFGPAGAWIMYRLGDRMIDRVLAGPINEFRARLGLPPVRRIMNDWWLSPDRVLGSWPEWYAPAAPDWPQQVRLTGFAYHDSDHDAQAIVRADRFIDQGPPPVLFTPGTAMRHAHGFFRAAVEACGLTGNRGILVTLYPEHVPAALPAKVIHVTHLPFGTFLPRVAAIVHHGGVGTVAQALRAARPQIVCPVGFDQFDNAARVVRLGCGASIRPRRVSGRHLAAALDCVLNSADVHAHCREHAARIDAVAGVRQACDMIEQVLSPERTARDHRPCRVGR